MRRTPTPRPTLLLGMPAAFAALFASSTMACAQARTAPRAQPTPKAERSSSSSDRTSSSEGGRTQVYRWSSGDDDSADRAVIGVSTASNAGKRDTLGVMVQSVTSGGPAEKAGIEEGDRIAAINGVSLRLSPEDAGEPDMGGLMTHRLRREMDKVKPGATVELSVYSGGQTKTVRVTTVSADSLSGRRVSMERVSSDERPVIGLNISASGSRRDTLGALVSAVATDGPAEKAGIVEGDRIAAINGVDLRVAREDAGDPWASSVKMNRFQRELRKVKAGDAVELRVVTAGQSRTVRVTAAKAKDVYKGRAEGGMRIRVGDLAGVGFDGFDGFGEGGFLAPLPPMPPSPPRMPRMAPLPPSDVIIDPASFEMLRDLGERYRVMGDRVRDQARREARRGVRIDADAFALNSRGRMNATLSGESGTIGMSGLRLTRVNAELASYFGKDAEGGLLVTSSEGATWKALREGDVIISVNGTAVRQGNQTRISLDRSERTELEVLRKGKREKIVVEGDR
jgi:S1-C subfamily serine protease